jgi:hypothetical protein
VAKFPSAFRFSASSQFQDMIHPEKAIQAYTNIQNW